MAYVNLTPYDAQLAAVQRQQQLAQLLQNEAAQSIQTGSYNGIPGIISPYQGAAKLAQAIASVFAQNRADRQARDLEATQRQAASDMLDKYYAPSQTQYTLPDNGATSGGLIGGAMAPDAYSPTQPIQMPPQFAPQPGPPPAQTQATATPPPSTLPQLPDQGFQLPPDAQTVQQTQIPVTAQDRARMAAQALASGNPYLAQIAPTLYNQAAQQAQLETDRQRVAASIDQLPFEAPQKALIKQIADFGGPAAAASAAQSLMKGADETNDVKNYMFAKRNGYTGDFLQWQKDSDPAKFHHFVTVNRPDQGQDVIDVLGGGGPQPQGGAPLDARKFFQDFVMPHEGGLNPSDMNGSPTKYGINQAANPDVDVKNLQPSQAADIFANKYFAASGAGNLPPALAAVHADTYFINPAKAQQFLQQSGGDPAKYMALRQAWMNGMVASNPAAAKYAKAWTQRNADLAQYAAQAGGSAAPATGGPQTVYSTPDTAETLTPEAKEMAAAEYAMTGKLPQMGYGKLSTQRRTEIINRGAQLINEWGITPEDRVTGMAQFKVAQGSLAKLTPMIAQMTASENTVNQNANYALSLAPKGADPTGVPIFNKWVQAGRQSIAGDANVAAFNQAIKTVADEYARVMTSNTGSGGTTSDNARREAYGRLDAAATIPQLQQVIKAMQVEMGNRISSYNAQKTQLANILRNPTSAPGFPASAVQPPPAAAPRSRADILKQYGIQ